MTTRPYLEKVVLGEERGALSWVIRGLLWPLSLVYSVGLAVYLGLYRIGLRRRHRLQVPVISVGNLTFGGTGKTPAVQAICRLLTERGLKVAVLSRGHGGKARRPTVVSDGQSVLVSADEAGDEPVLLASTLPGVPVVVGKDRRVSGRIACERFSPDVVVLDDGLQYWQLYRDLDIVVLDAKRPFGSGLVMPAGDLREPAGGVRRAGIVLITNVAGVDQTGLDSLIARIPPNAAVFKAAHTPDAVVRPDGASRMPADWLRGRKVVAFCGIGRPESFFSTLKSLGAEIVERAEFADHYAYDRDDVARLNESRTANGAEALVTTEKDAIRIPAGALDELYILSIRLDIEDYTEFTDRISRTYTQAGAAQKAD